MSKKKNKKASLAIAKENVKILKSGKLKVKKGEKLSLKPFITESLNDVVVSRIEGILSKENVSIKDTPKTSVSVNLTSTQKMADVLSKMGDESDIQTICYIVTKKQYSEIFDMLHGSIVGELMRSSTLASIYAEIEADWNALNEDDKSAFTNVLFIPKILVFLDPDTGKMRRAPYKINLLIIAEPTAKYQAIEKPSVEQVAQRAITDTFESAVLCGAKNLIISPLAHEMFHDNEPWKSSGMWHDAVTTDRVLKNIERVSFTVNDEDLYIIFMKNNTFGGLVALDNYEVQSF